MISLWNGISIYWWWATCPLISIYLSASSFYSVQYFLEMSIFVMPWCNLLSLYIITNLKDGCLTVLSSIHIHFIHQPISHPCVFLSISISLHLSICWLLHLPIHAQSILYMLAIYSFCWIYSSIYIYEFTCYGVEINICSVCVDVRTISPLCKPMIWSISGVEITICSFCCYACPWSEVFPTLNCFICSGLVWAWKLWQIWN